MTTPLPHPSRLSPRDPRFEEIIAAHDAAVQAGETSYRDPATGLIVLTVSAHVERGNCCHSGCRHCPYVDAV